MPKKKPKDQTTLDLLIEQMQSPDLESCAIVLVTKNGSYMIGGHNIDEIDIIELLQKGVNMMIDEGTATIGKTFH